jgi:hypothetical protein
MSGSHKRSHDDCHTHRNKQQQGIIWALPQRCMFVVAAQMPVWLCTQVVVVFLSSDRQQKPSVQEPGQQVLQTTSPWKAQNAQPAIDMQRFSCSQSLHQTRILISQHKNDQLLVSSTGIPKCVTCTNAEV